MTFTEQDVVRTVRRLTLRELRAWVRAGWVQPAEDGRNHVFDDMDIARLRLVCDLKKEMGFSNDTVPTILSLLDQVHGLRCELKTLAQAIDRQPVEIRQAIRVAYETLNININGNTIQRDQVARRKT